MKYRLLFIFFLIGTIKIAYAQADLICSNITNSTMTIDRGNQLFFSFRVKNIGKAKAANTHAIISLVEYASATEYPLTVVSTEALDTNSETGNYDFIYPVPYNMPSGLAYLKVSVNCRNEITESNVNNNGLFGQINITISNNNSGMQNLPYPIILVHGWCGNDTTWWPFLRNIQTYYGYSYGGNMNFCLNQDGNVSSSYLPTDFKDWTDTTQIGYGDFYTVNFDVDTYGNKYSVSTQSNQSAAVKQGVAIQKAIEHVLKVTGKDKVILVAHSMGGLACREYLQNTNRWQSDGQHHVAKLLTIGTPHGGSDATSANLTNIFDNADERSEAVRDLRRSYAISGSSGVYLYGGLEDLSVLNNSLIENYYNADVNCDGYVEENITGINYKTIPTDLAYTCIIGNDTYSPGLCSNCDGVVGFTYADLNNYLPQVNADTLFCAGSGWALHPWHLEEPKQTNFIMRGIDEPDTKDKAYLVKFGPHYFGHFNAKNKASLSTTDSDYYKIKVTTYGNLSFYLEDIPTSQAVIRIFDSATNINKLYYHSNGKGYLGFLINGVKPGTYYINIYSVPDAISWQYPYVFRMLFKTSIPIAGKIINPKDQSIVHVSINLLGDSTNTIYSDSIGNYIYTLLNVGNYKIKPTKNNDINKTNGVTAVDIALTQAHILGKNILNSPYKLIAADVNGDGKVTALDIVYMKRLILGIDSTFNNSVTNEKRLWAFVDSSYKFADSTNPFPFKDSISYTNLNANQTNQTFIGIKLGDVNWDWNPALAKMPSQSLPALPRRVLIQNSREAKKS